MKGGKESKELSCSVFSLSLRLNGQMTGFQETLYTIVCVVTFGESHLRVRVDRLSFDWQIL